MDGCVRRSCRELPSKRYGNAVPSCTRSSPPRLYGMATIRLTLIAATLVRVCGAARTNSEIAGLSTYVLS